MRKLDFSKLMFLAGSLSSAKSVFRRRCADSSGQQRTTLELLEDGKKRSCGSAQPQSRGKPSHPRTVKLGMISSAGSLGAVVQ